jgi:hypothetical protein
MNERIREIICKKIFRTEKKARLFSGGGYCAVEYEPDCLFPIRIRQIKN